MIKTSQKLTSLFFILLGLTPLLFIVVISIKEKEIRHRMEKEMENGHLQILIVQEQEVIWMDKHEIWIDNKMFDIRSKHLENGVYTFTGLFDPEETLLVMQEKNAASETNEENEFLGQLLKCLPEFCNQHKEHIDLAYLQDPYRSFISTTPAHPFREILTPPPQC